MEPKVVVIYHKADFDGLFSHQIAKRFFDSKERENVIYIGWDYGDPITLEMLEADELYMIDISVDGLMDHHNLIWIDHHKSAIEKFGHKTGVQVDGVAACRLAWQWFFGCEIGNFCGHYGLKPNAFPSLEDFKNRNVDEPYAVQLAGEYDIWDKRNPEVDTFQHGLRAQELTGKIWEQLLGPESEYACLNLLERGSAIEYMMNLQNASVIKSQGFVTEFEGLRFLACNHARFNSLLFDARVDNTQHDALLGFCWDGGKGKWKVSLYHTAEGKHLDLSLIAVKNGGGGHRGACGFVCDELPFQLNQLRPLE